MRSKSDDTSNSVEIEVAVVSPFRYSKRQEKTDKEGPTHSQEKGHVDYLPYPVINTL